MRRLAPLLLVAVACMGGETLTLSASAPFSYPAPVNASLERVAVLVTIANKSDNDLPVNPADFAARDSDNRIYPANPVAMASDARVVALIGGQLGMRGLLPLPAANLRKNDLLSGFVVFEVPAGVRPIQLVFRQSDTDHVVDLPAPR